MYLHMVKKPNNIKRLLMKIDRLLSSFSPAWTNFLQRQLLFLLSF